MSIYLAEGCRIFVDLVALGSGLAVGGSHQVDLVLGFVDIRLGCWQVLVHLVADSQLVYHMRTVSVVEVDDHSHIVAVVDVPSTTRVSSHSLCEP